MNPSYCRIRVPKDEALRRFADWNQLSQVGPLLPANISEAIPLACDKRGMWLGKAVFVSEVGEWTLFQDLSGALSAIPGHTWLQFAKNDELVFAGYNDAIGYGELVEVSAGIVRREFLDDRDSPESNVNAGRLEDPHEPFESWIEVASYVDDDDLGFSDVGWLWIY